MNVCMNWGECYNVAFSDFVENLKWETSLVGLLWQLENRLKRFRAWSRGVVNIIFFLFLHNVSKGKKDIAGPATRGWGHWGFAPPLTFFFAK